jgi:SpoVK/Ycf46/Vps4 family AAA+-type ATPase
MNNRRVLKKYFKEFINILDTKSDYYILNYYMNEMKKEQGGAVSNENGNENGNEKGNEKGNENSNKENTNFPVSDVIFSNPNSIFVAKNADHIPLPPPRYNPDSIYGVGGGVGGEASRESIGVTDARDNAKIDEINIDIDDKNTCYIKNCKNCKNRISYKVNKVNINAEINSIGDLIRLCNDYKLAENVEYNIDMKSLHKINDDLVELNNMIGMKTLKENIVDQLLFYLQNLHVYKDMSTSTSTSNGNKRTNVETGDFLHTVIYGSPGTGKTEVAKIIGRIYANLGVIKSKPMSLSDKKKSSSSLSPSWSSSRPKFKKVTRSDLIAGYLGQTALKTKDVIKDSLGGVLFIDEAYALGNTDKRDSFAKECIDTLCEALSDNKDSLMVIIAGYEKELNECFFSYNEGLNSRFIWRFKVDDYEAEDLRNIFVKKAHDFGWLVHEELKVEWFEKNMKYFKYYGRDMETLFTKTKIAHSRRVFCKPEEMKKKIIMKDLENGFKLFIKNDEVKNRVNDSELKILQNMYL